MKPASIDPVQIAPPAGLSNSAQLEGVEESGEPYNYCHLTASNYLIPAQKPNPAIPYSTQDAGQRTLPSQPTGKATTGGQLDHFDDLPDSLDHHLDFWKAYNADADAQDNQIVEL